MVNLLDRLGDSRADLKQRQLRRRNELRNGLGETLALLRAEARQGDVLHQSRAVESSRQRGL